MFFPKAIHEYHQLYKKNTGLDVCRRPCEYKVIETDQRSRLYNALYGTVHYIT